LIQFTCLLIFYCRVDLNLAQDPRHFGLKIWKICFQLFCQNIISVLYTLFGSTPLAGLVYLSEEWGDEDFWLFYCDRPLFIPKSLLYHEVLGKHSNINRLTHPSILILLLTDSLFLCAYFYRYYWNRWFLFFQYNLDALKKVNMNSW
jgi:hypothetical protein